MKNGHTLSLTDPTLGMSQGLTGGRRTARYPANREKKIQRERSYEIPYLFGSTEGIITFIFLRGYRSDSLKKTQLLALSL